MLPTNFFKAALLAVFIVVLAFASWETYLRKNLQPSYDDGKELWANERSQVYLPQNKATVFIGSSRIKYDLDAATWRRLTGEEPVMLACEGASPLPALDDLAADEKFRGKLVIDVTEGLFFSTPRPNRNDVPSYVSYAKKVTPAEKVSFAINHQLEKSFVFLDRDNFSINSFLGKLPLAGRPGVFAMPLFPLGFGRVNFDRQNKMTPDFVQDTLQHKKVTDIWTLLIKTSKEPPASGALLDSFLNVVSARVKKIQSRGGQVVFVRTPSSGPFWAGEQKGFPREKYWEPLLQKTGAVGIHFTDYPPIAHFICPEWSHLTPTDAITFTRHFVQLLQQKGWQFTGTASSTAFNLQP